MVGNFLERAIGGIETDLAVALIVVLNINAAVVGSPLRVLDVAIQLVGNRARSGAIAVHQVEFRVLVALVAVVITLVDDPLAVGRNGR